MVVELPKQGHLLWWRRGGGSGSTLFYFCQPTTNILCKTFGRCFQTSGLSLSKPYPAEMCKFYNVNVRVLSNHTSMINRTSNIFWPVELVIDITDKPRWALYKKRWDGVIIANKSQLWNTWTYLCWDSIMHKCLSVFSHASFILMSEAWVDYICTKVSV